MKLQTSIPAISIWQEDTEAATAEKSLCGLGLKEGWLQGQKAKPQTEPQTTQRYQAADASASQAVMFRTLPGVSQRNNDSLKQHDASDGKRIENHLQRTSARISLEHFCR